MVCIFIFFFKKERTEKKTWQNTLKHLRNSYLYFFGRNCISNKNYLPRLLWISGGEPFSSKCSLLIAVKTEKQKNGTLVRKGLSIHPANIYLFKVNNRNTRKICKICSKLTIKTPERRQWRSSGVFIINIFHTFF